MKIKHVVSILVFGLVITACENDDNLPIVPSGEYAEGILVSNEGPFSNGTGTVSFISNDLETVETAIYNQVNSRDLGNIVQSIGFADDKAYVVANNSNTIAVVDRYTFEEEGLIISGLSNPRYFIEVNGKGYVTNWGDTADETDDYIAIINLTSNTVEGTISVDFGPENITSTSNTIYVAHQGAFGQNNKVSVIDTSSNAVETTITVGDVPNAIQLDDSDNLWVLASGKPSYSGEETGGSLTKINTSTNEVALTLDFDVIEHPSHLALAGSDLYYALNGSVYSISTAASALPAESTFDDIISYALAIDNGKLYTTDAKDYASNGSLTVYDLSTKAVLKTVEVGIIPGGIYFN